MASTSIGLIETRGLTASIEAADAMLKAADVELLGTEKIGSGLVTVMVTDVYKRQECSCSGRP